MPRRAELTPLSANGVTLWVQQSMDFDRAYGYKDELIERTEGIKTGVGLPFVAWGEKNLYPLEFLDLFTRHGGNPIFERVKSEQARMILGMGLEFTGPLDAVTRAKRMVSRTDLATWAYDMAVFGAFSAIHVYDADEVEAEPGAFGIDLGTRQLKAVYAAPVASVRMGEPWRDDSGQIDVDYFLVAPDWRKIQINTISRSGGNLVQPGVKDEAYRPEILVKVGTSQERIGHIATQTKGIYRGDGEQLYLRAMHYDVEYHPASYLYPKPDSESSLTELQTSAKIAAWYHRYVRTGGAPSGIIKYPKQIAIDPVTMQPTREEMASQKAIAEALEKQYAGEENAGKIGVLFFDPMLGHGVGDWLSPPADGNDKRWVEVAKLVQQNALTGLGAVAPEMYGIATAAGFGGKAETIDLAYRLTETNYVAPLRKRIVDYLNKALKPVGVTAQINPLPSPFAKLEPTSPAP